MTEWISCEECFGKGKLPELKSMWPSLKGVTIKLKEPPDCIACNGTGFKPPSDAPGSHNAEDEGDSKGSG